MKHTRTQTGDTYQRTSADNRRIVEEMTVMAEIGRVISSTLQIEEIYEHFAAEVRKLIPFDRISLNLIDPGRETFTITYVSGHDVFGRRPGDTVRIAGSICEEIVNQQTGILCLPVDDEELLRRFPRASTLTTVQSGMRSIIGVPLISGGVVIGTLHFRSREPFAYTEQDLHLAERIGRQIAGAVANAQLFSSLAKTGEILRESEARHRAIVEQAAVGVAEVELLTGRFLSVNRRLCEILGWSEAELLASTFLSITHPEDLHVHEEGMRLLRAGTISNFSVEKRYLRKDGEPIWVNLTISALWKPEELPRNNLVIIQDISEQKHAETALRQSETKYRTLFESAGDYIFVLLPDAQKGLVIVDANQAAVMRHGYSRQELIGRSILELNTHAYRKKKEEIVRYLRQPGDSLLFETEHIGKEGQTFPVEVSARLIQIETGAPFILAIERDITERKRIEEDLRLSREAAERLAQEMAIITDVGRKTSSTLNIDEVFERLAVESRKLISHDRLVVTRINPREGTYTVVYIAGMDHPERKVGNSYPLAGAMSEAVWKQKTGIIVQAEDEGEINRICPYITNLQMGILSLMSVPLTWHDEVIGTFNFRSTQPNAYTERDLRLVEGIGREIAGAIINAQLYTDLQRTEKSLRERKELFSRLIDAVPDAVIQTDSDNRILFANEVALKMGGYADVDEIRGKDLLAFVAPEDHERVAVNSRSMLRRKMGPQPYRLITANGRRIATEVNADFLRNDDGSAFGTVLICRDVTERNRIVEALRESEANYRFLTDNMNDLIWTVDLNLRTTFVNKSVDKLLGFTPEERLEKPFQEKCTPESYALIRKIIANQQDIEKSGSGTPSRTITIETEYYHKDGSTVWMESLVSGLRDEHGVLIGYHGVSRNITERKKLERELRRILDNLEDRVRERTVELEDLNTALSVLLKKGEQDLRKLEHDIKDNIDRLVVPFLQKLKIGSSALQNKAYADIIEMNLTNIVSPFINHLSDSYKKLTPKEIQIAAMIKDGRSSKEISAIIGVSVGTVVTHRNNIRKKLKLNSRDVNLRSHLLTLS